MNHHDKLDDAQAAITSMAAARTFPEFRRAFEACLTALRAVGDGIKTDVRRMLKRGRRREVPDFDAWFKANYEKLTTSDPLLDWVRMARNADLHEGAKGLWSVFHTGKFDAAAAGPPPVEGATLVLDADGPYWTYQEPSGRKRRIPIALPPGAVLEVYCTHPPLTHLGAPIRDTRPDALCRLALDFYESLSARVGREEWVKA